MGFWRARSHSQVERSHLLQGIFGLRFGEEWDGMERVLAFVPFYLRLASGFLSRSPLRIVD
jgi:hypothetical protein